MARRSRSGSGGDVPAVCTEHVEQVVLHRRPLHLAGDLARSLQVHARLQQRKAGPPALVDRDDLSVDDRRLIAEADIDVGDLRVLERDVVAAAGDAGAVARRPRRRPHGCRPISLPPTPDRPTAAPPASPARASQPVESIGRSASAVGGHASGSPASGAVEAGAFGRAGGRRPASRPERTASTRAATVGSSACAEASTGMPSGCTRPSMSVFMRCSSQVDFSPSPSVRISASRTRPERPAGAALERWR